jgi:hypothetical protein
MRCNEFFQRVAHVIIDRPILSLAFLTDRLLIEIHPSFLHHALPKYFFD